MLGGPQPCWATHIVGAAANASAAAADDLPPRSHDRFSQNAKDDLQMQMQRHRSIENRIAN
jgi:hypothetical protein